MIETVPELNNQFLGSVVLLHPFNDYKKRKVDFACGCLMKNGKNSIFVEVNNGTATCVTCNKSVAILKKYNLCRHNTVAQSGGIIKSSTTFNPKKQAFKRVLDLT